MSEEIYSKISQFAKVEKDSAFSKMTTLRIGGSIAYVVYPETLLALQGIMDVIEEHHLTFKVVGKGSNLLCSDDHYDGVVIRFDRFMNQTYVYGDHIYAYAGCSYVLLSNIAMKHGLSGLEFASSIPGTVGGAIFMNAGAYKEDTAMVVEKVLVFQQGKLVWLDQKDCAYQYRTSIFQKHPEWLIIAAIFHLKPKDSALIQEVMEDRRARRMAAQPLNYPSCGSVFKNPNGKNAWQCVEEIGYRGKRIGGAMVSEKHCNFIINVDQAKATDYLNLVKEIQQKVKQQLGIELHTEMERFNWK